MKVIDVCGTCNNCTKIVDYFWDMNYRDYSKDIKTVGYLCKSKDFLRKHYRRPDDYIGNNCKDYIKCENIEIMHNNQIYKK